MYFDRSRSVFLSALASYNLNGRKRDVDITRGDILMIQGGAGVRLFKLLTVGMASYALWQVRDDRGADVPAVLRGARDQVYGLGPEVGLRIPTVNINLSARYEHDFDVHSRPEGQGGGVLGDMGGVAARGAGAKLASAVAVAAMQPRPMIHFFFARSAAAIFCASVSNAGELPFAFARPRCIFAPPRSPRESASCALS